MRKIFNVFRGIYLGVGLIVFGAIKILAVPVVIGLILYYNHVMPGWPAYLIKWCFIHIDVILVKGVELFIYIGIYEGIALLLSIF